MTATGPVVLVVTRGAAGAGKTTWAKAWVAQDRKRRLRVNRDALRLMGSGGYVDAATDKTAITTGARALIGTWLRAGFSVVCDDTNLEQRHVDELAAIAAQAGAEFVVHDMRHVDEATCLARNAGRPEAEQVPDEVIRAMFRNHITPAPTP